MTVVLILIIVALLAMFISTKLGLTALVAWMVENNIKTPSDEEIQRLIRWCAKKYIETWLGKS